MDGFLSLQNYSEKINKTIMKNNVDKQYLKYLKYILNNGVKKVDRTGTGTISIFDYSMRFNMSEGFPLLTSKKVFTKAVIHELIWFLKGDTNIKYLVDNGVHIWDGDSFVNYLKTRDRFSNKDNVKEDVVINGMNGSSNRPYTQEEFIDKIKTDTEFANKWGELGPVYGKQWRSWNSSEAEFEGLAGIDQIQTLINDLKTNPDSRRLMVNAWNVGELDQMVLPPCHFGFQCYTSELTIEQRKKWWCDYFEKDISYADDISESELDEQLVPKRKLDLKWFQRSVDSPLGLPFNIASYAILLHLLAKEVNMVPNDLIFSGGDCHIYLNQIKGVNEQLKRETFKLPKLKLHNESIFDLKYEDFEIIDYKSSPTIQFPLSN
jgi:thymidylate synthase